MDRRTATFCIVLGILATLVAGGLTWAGIAERIVPADRTLRLAVTSPTGGRFTGTLKLTLDDGSVVTERIDAPAPVSREWQGRKYVLDFVWVGGDLDIEASGRRSSWSYGMHGVQPGKPETKRDRITASSGSPPAIEAPPLIAAAIILALTAGAIRLLLWRDRRRRQLAGA